MNPPVQQVVTERRRSPRFDIAAGGTAVLPVQTSVRVVDISLSGVLLESTQPAREGTLGRLRLDLGHMPFTAHVEVCRVSSAAGRSDLYRIGARFLGLNPEHAQMIARFTRR